MWMETARLAQPMMIELTKTMTKRIMSGFFTEDDVVMGLSMYDYFNNLILYSGVKDADSMIGGFRFFRKFILYTMAKSV